MKINLIIKILLILLFCNNISNAQSLLFPQDYIFEQIKYNETILIAKDSIHRPGIFPFANGIDTLTFYKANRKWLSKKLLQDNFINIKKNDTINNEVNEIKICVDPVFNFSVGREYLNNKTINTYNNTRGVLAFLSINKNLKLETAFIENQSVFPELLSEQIKNKNEVLGLGRWKTFKENGFDYAMSAGILWWKINNHIQLYTGHGKQKIGNGYRSFFLSDLAFNYPFARFDFSFFKSKINYSITNAVLMNLSPTVNINNNRPPGTEPLLQKKPFSFQYLNYTMNKVLQFGFFQGIVWPASNEKNRLNLSANYFNPILFSNLATYGFNSKPNILAGFDCKINLTKTFDFYFQLCTDGKKDSLKNTQSIGLQSGLKWFNAFGLKNLFVQFEYNEFTNALYQQSIKNSQDSYSHYNSSLAYPINSNTGNELVSIIAWRYKRMLFSIKNNYFESAGTDNLLSEGKLSFILQPKTNMNFSVGFISRDIHKSQSQINSNKSTWLFISFATSLYNRYFDTE